MKLRILACVFIEGFLFSLLLEVSAIITSTILDCFELPYLVGNTNVLRKTKYFSVFYNVITINFRSTSDKRGQDRCYILRNVGTWDVMRKSTSGDRL